jgi:adenylate cyclase
METPQYLVRKIYPPRVLGYALAIAVTVFLRGGDLLKDYAFTAIVVCLAAYPFFAFYLNRKFFNSSQGARFSMLMDGGLVGVLIIINHFYLSSILTFVTFLAVSTALIAGPALVVASLSIVMVVVLLGWWSGAPNISQASMWVELSFAVAMLVYLGFVAWLVFGVTRTMGIARRDAQAGRRSGEAMNEHLKRYISPQLYATLATASGDRTNNRRQLTVCFTDLSGFTALMDRLPEESITRVLNEYLNAMADIAIRYGGTVDKFMGDGVMVFFGDPETNGAKEDAIACVKMALGMRGCLAGLARRWRTEGLDNQLQMRVGIHSGYCSVGNFGSESRMDYTAVGGVVNIASRLEASAPIDGILISSSTRALVHEAICLEPFERQQLKGITKPVETFRVLAESRERQLEKLDEEVPGLRVQLNPREVNVAAARALLELALENLSRIEKNRQTRQGVVRLLR